MFKKFIAILLGVIIMSTMFISSCGDNSGTSSNLTSSTLPTQTTPKADFDDENVLFKFAVLSDVHLSYAYHTSEQILNNADRYADAIAYMHSLSGGELDSILFCGDYTDLGNEGQARTFADATKTIIEGIFGDKKPATIIGMGNHDTCWSGCMTDKEWYNILGQYGFNDGLEADSDYELGNLHYIMEKQGEVYHIIYIETMDYAENVFHAKTLYWLENLLNKITRETPDHHIIVGTHAPISESGVYGTDLELDGGANWATAKDNIHNVLKKFPQVTVFSGHTHYSEYLETTIMQKDYTALNVSATLSFNFYNSQYNKYLDDNYSGRSGGMGYYIEIDKNGAMKISRVDFSYSSDAAKIEKKSSETLPNPLYGVKQGYSETFETMTFKNCTLTGDMKVAYAGDDWIIPAPDAEKKHLTYYSPERGDLSGIGFPESAKLDAYKPAGSTIGFSFPAAKSNNFILKYVVTVYDENGTELAKYNILGNYCDNKTGVVTGTNHLDATLFSYNISNINTKGTVRVELYAVDEYGNKSGTLSATVE